MKNVKDQVYAALAEVFENVTDQYPTDWATLPAVEYIERETAERYGWPYIDTPDGRFYRCFGQAAQPYMYPALKNNEQEIERIFEEAVKKKK